MSIEAYQGTTSIAATVESFGRLSDQIAQTDFVPSTMRGKPAVVLACMMYGAELGLGPMQSLTMIQSIQGSVGLKPEGMRALVTERGHRIKAIEYTDTAVTLRGWRKGDSPEDFVDVRFTIDDANRAELGRGANWKKYPRAMLTARATSELCRLHFADVIGGLSYTPDEIMDFDQPERVAVSSWTATGTPALPQGDPDTGEVLAIPATSSAPVESFAPQTTRRGPPVPAGHITAASAKNELIAAYQAQGLTEDSAKESAATLWKSYNLTSAAIPDEQLAILLGDVELAGMGTVETVEEQPTLEPVGGRTELLDDPF